MGCFRTGVPVADTDLFVEVLVISVKFQHIIQLYVYNTLSSMLLTSTVEFCLTQVSFIVQTFCCGETAFTVTYCNIISKAKENYPFFTQIRSNTLIL